MKRLVLYRCKTNCEVLQPYRVRPRSEPPDQKNKLNPSFSPRDISTIMDPILNAIADMDSREPRPQLLYRDAAKIWGVS
jgi:hypothetical protein